MIFSRLISRRLALFFPVAVFAAALVPPAHAAAAARAKAADDSSAYKGVIVLDAATGNVLVEDHADVVNPPASMTKLMTFAVLQDKLADGTLRLDTKVNVTVEDAKIGGTQVFLDSRESFPVEELIYAMMIQSANDAAHCLAHAAAGSVPAFVELMNAKAKALGMTHTTFRTPHGLPPTSRQIADGDLTTPRDFALLCRYLLIKTNVLKYTAVQNRAFGTGVRSQPQNMINHNNLLGKVAGVDGLKTGYTAGAGYCLSATAERNGHRVIVVIMGSFGPGGQIDKGVVRDRKAIEFLERGFTALPANAPLFSTVRPPTPPPVIVATKPEATPPADTTPPPIKFTVPGKKK